MVPGQIGAEGTPFRGGSWRSDVEGQGRDMVRLEWPVVGTMLMALGRIISCCGHGPPCGVDEGGRKQGRTRLGR